MTIDVVLQVASVIKILTGLPFVIGEIITIFKPTDALDLLIVSAIIYFILIFIRQTRSFFIFNSLFFLVIINFIAQFFDLGLTRQLLQPLTAFFLFIFVIVFQREIRRFFKWFAAGRMISTTEVPASEQNILIITKAVFDMAKKKIGAIIVFPGEYPLEELLEAGFPLEGRISYPLIVSIFDSASPGHDGAMLIENNKILRFALHLPLAEDFKMTNVGTRHRAAVGITERTDALSIVVSEERGTVSVAEGGALRSVLNEADLIAILKAFIKETTPNEAKSFWQYFLVHNVFMKVASFGIAFVLWLIFIFHV